MQFRICGHKAEVAQPFQYGIGKRLRIAGFGALFLIGGLFRLANGVLVVPDRILYVHATYSHALITTGVAVVLLAIVPSSWLDQAAKRIAGVGGKRKTPGAGGQAGLSAGGTHPRYPLG